LLTVGAIWDHIGVVVPAKPEYIPPKLRNQMRRLSQRIVGPVDQHRAVDDDHNHDEESSIHDHDRISNQIAGMTKGMRLLESSGAGKRACIIF
jgi:hypothetical protein